MNTYKLLAETRVRTSDGEASFFLPTSKGLIELDNDALGGKWVRLQAGSLVTLVARYEKTDTYLAAVTTVKDGEPHIQGVALRRMSWNNVVAGSELVSGDAVAENAAVEVKAEEAKPEITAEQEAELFAMLQLG